MTSYRKSVQTLLKLVVSIDFSAFASVYIFFYRNTAYRMELVSYNYKKQ